MENEKVSAEKERAEEHNKQVCPTTTDFILPFPSNFCCCCCCLWCFLLCVCFPFLSLSLFCWCDYVLVGLPAWACSVQTAGWGAVSKQVAGARAFQLSLPEPESADWAHSVLWQTACTGKEDHKHWKTAGRVQQVTNLLYKVTERNSCVHYRYCVQEVGRGRPQAAGGAGRSGDEVILWCSCCHPLMCMLTLSRLAEQKQSVEQEKEKYRLELVACRAQVQSMTETLQKQDAMLAEKVGCGVEARPWTSRINSWVFYFMLQDWQKLNI